MYVNTASLSNGTSFVESLFEEFGTWDHPRMVLGLTIRCWAGLPAGYGGSQGGRREAEAVSLCLRRALSSWVPIPASL